MSFTKDSFYRHQVESLPVTRGARRLPRRGTRLGWRVEGVVESVGRHAVYSTCVFHEPFVNGLGDFTR